MTDLRVAIIDPGNRVEKMFFPLQSVDRVTVDVEPENREAYDVLIQDMVNFDLGKEVLRRPMEAGKLVYRMRGDIFAEMSEWDHISPVRKWAAKKAILPYVQGCLAVTDWMAAKYRNKTGVHPVDSAGLPKRVDHWPDNCEAHTDEELRCSTLTNANYFSKIQALVDWAPAVEAVLEDVGGRWEICGDGKYDGYLARAMDRFENIEFVGYVDAKEQMQWSNCMLHFSNLDGQPNSLLEGMASGLPVVTNDFVSFREYEGPVVVADDPPDLRDRLHELTDPAARAELGHRGREHIAAHHSPEAIGEQYVGYFERLLNGQT